MRRCVVPGSYDPVTLGHLDIAQRAAHLFDEVYLTVVENPSKAGLFTPAQRAELITASLSADDAAAITVSHVSGTLLVDYCREVDATAIVKGLRGGTDFAYELPMALMNKNLTGIETVFLAGAPELEHISSSLIKEVAKYGGDISGMVPGPVADALRDVYST